VIKIISSGIKLLSVGLALLLGGFGTFLVSIYSLIPFTSYTGIIGVSAFIIGLGFTALASIKISFRGGNNNGNSN
jgi:hypothetical protein